MSSTTSALSFNRRLGLFDQLSSFKESSFSSDTNRGASQTSPGSGKGTLQPDFRTRPAGSRLMSTPLRLSLTVSSQPGSRSNGPDKSAVSNSTASTTSGTTMAQSVVT